MSLAVAEELLSPRRLFTRDQVLARPCPIPAEPGVYAWYFDKIPAGVPVDGCNSVGAHTLLYVGISPKAPPRGGGPGSSQKPPYTSQVSLLW
jgi:hypothetical protein